MITSSLLVEFLKNLHNSKGSNKMAFQIANEVGITEDVLDKLIEKGFLFPTSFGLPDYRVADPILYKLGLKPHQ